MFSSPRHKKLAYDQPPARELDLVSRGLIKFAAAATGLLSAPLMRLPRPDVSMPSPALVISNHRSVLDGPLLLMTLVRAGVHPHVMITAGPFAVPVLGKLMHRAGMIPVKRGTDRVGDALSDAKRLLAGGVVAMMPEGGIGKLDEEVVGPLKSGASRLTGAPVYTVVFSGTSDALKHGWLHALRTRPVIGLDIAEVQGDMHEALTAGVRRARANR